jgi:outer membrane murein-binding lipoprotein Lpp
MGTENLKYTSTNSGTIEAKSPLSEITRDRGSDVALSTISRRETLRITLAASALLLVAGCSMFRKSDSDLDKAFSNLRATLDEIATDTDQQERLIAIAGQIETACRGLTDEHDAFVEQFEGDARQRDISSSALEQVVEGFAERRTEHRNQLLVLQDELRAELTEQEWAMALEALNQTQEAYTRPKVGSS